MQQDPLPETTDPTTSTSSAAARPLAPPPDLTPAAPPTPLRTETLAPYTSVYGADSRRRVWSGEGEAQGEAYHAKQLAFQQEIMPRFHKLKMF